MGAYLDLDDVVAGQPKAQVELAELREELEEQRRLRDHFSNRVHDKQREVDQILADRRRLEWFFSHKPDHSFVATYMEGMTEGWTPDQWRAAIDRHMEAQGGG